MYDSSKKEKEPGQLVATGSFISSKEQSITSMGTLNSYLRPTAFASKLMVRVPGSGQILGFFFTVIKYCVSYEKVANPFIESKGS